MDVWDGQMKPSRSLGVVFFVEKVAGKALTVVARAGPELFVSGLVVLSCKELYDKESTQITIRTEEESDQKLDNSLKSDWEKKHRWTLRPWRS